MNSGVVHVTMNALTIDVEDYFHVHAFSHTIDPAEWDDYPSRVEANTRRILEILDSHRVCATFFVLGWVAKRYPKLALEIRSAGHQVGCHGFAHRAIYAGSPADFRQDVRLAKAVLEDAIG